MKMGFIGGGNMASAMVKGILDQQLLDREHLIVSDQSEECCQRLREKFGIEATQDNLKVVDEARCIVLAVKPQYYQEVIRQIRDDISVSHLIVTIAPGKTLQWLEDCFVKDVKLIRTMPNTPAQVGAGMTGICANDRVTREELRMVCRIFNSFGKSAVLPESTMDAVVAVSGSSPAYVFLFLEALADAAVADGMSRKMAYEFAAQAVYGSAKMMLETGLHPGELKDMVCSPGGTTIEAVRVLEEKGFRSSIMEAARACAKKARQM
ncbi:MAG: pyrroline-5-carboxylate reductase [Lachnospiraceae bacterium]|nr:pyrroline-5-carboxylate reductase [Lachnospiraceae bacterium]